MRLRGGSGAARGTLWCRLGGRGAQTLGCLVAPSWVRMGRPYAENGQTARVGAPSSAGSPRGRPSERAMNCLQAPKSAIESHLAFAQSPRVREPISKGEFAAVPAPPPRSNPLRHSTRPEGHLLTVPIIPPQRRTIFPRATMRAILFGARASSPLRVRGCTLPPERLAGQIVGSRPARTSRRLVLGSVDSSLTCSRCWGR